MALGYIERGRPWAVVGGISVRLELFTAFGK